jgi:hypothetical protein
MHGADSSSTKKETLRFEWRVKIEALVEALQAGCQFCCYVATRMLSFNHVRHTSQSVRQRGIRCCAQGSATEDLKAIQGIIDNIQKLDCDADIRPEDRMLIFHCELLNLNNETGSFNHMVLSLPDVQIGGNLNEHKFAPMTVTVTGTNEHGENHSITGFFHLPGISDKGAPECALELYSLPSKLAYNPIMANLY